MASEPPTPAAARCLMLGAIACGLLFSRDAFPQARTPVTLPDLDLLRPQLRQEVQPVQQRPVALDAMLEPADYTVGPNDVLGINIWSSAPKEHTVTVSPEGTLIVPSCGSVNVRSMTLLRVKEIVAERLRGIYPSAEFSVTLLSPRKVIVTVEGDVVNEGTYELQSVQRVDQLLAAANAPTQSQLGSPQYDQQRDQVRRTASSRHILLHRRGGLTQRVDLLKYMITGKGEWNPYLQEGDMVIVPERPPLDRSVGVFGGVIRPGTHEFVPGERLSDLLAMALGFSPRADSISGLFTRLNDDGMAMESTGVDLAGIRTGTAPDPELQPGDRLVVREQVELRRNYMVAVEGEVHFPGQYPITRNSTRLSEVLRWAGGVTAEASLRAATVVRGNVQAFRDPDNVALEQLRSMRASLSTQDSGYYLAETMLRMRGEQVSVDFYRLLVLNDATEDVVLLPFDRILVPALQRTVYVFGQVVSPGHVPFVEGRGAQSYLEAVGGFAEEARTGDVKVIKAGTRAWLDPDETVIEDGDAIWVPREVQYSFAYYLATYASIAALVTAAASIAALVISINK